jgi:hypothetical protein
LNDDGHDTTTTKTSIYTN